MSPDLESCSLVLQIVDLATLTGACVIALGPSIAGIFTPSDELAKEVMAASEVSGEKLWRLPLEESYWESMKSGVADMVNTGGRPGGSITAALFLKQVSLSLTLYNLEKLEFRYNMIEKMSSFACLSSSSIKF